MQVILKQNVANLGLIGDVVDVKPGFFRNFLNPKGMAFILNSDSLKQREHQKRVIEAQKKKAKVGAEATQKEIEQSPLILEEIAHDQKLYGSITPQTIATQLKEKGLEIDRKMVQLENPIKTIGSFEVPIKLHQEITATLKLEIKASSKSPVAEKKEAKQEPKAKVAEETTTETTEDNS